MSPPSDNARKPRSELDGRAGWHASLSPLFIIFVAGIRRRSIIVDQAKNEALRLVSRFSSEHFSNLFIDAQANTCSDLYIWEGIRSVVIKRLLIVMLAFVVWSVQTVDAATDLSGSPGSPGYAGVAVESVVTPDAPASNIKSGCPVDCICHVFHHACRPDVFAWPFHAFERETFAIDKGPVRTSHHSAPPLRPPLT